MENVPVEHAKDHLEELMQRAARGEDVRISDPALGTVRLTPVRISDVQSQRVTDTMEPFVPLKQNRVLGHLKDKLPEPPAGFFDPLSDEDLKDWYGDDS